MRSRFSPADAGAAAASSPDFSVMYRTNAQSRAIEEACLQQGIRYRIVGGTRFYDRREVRDLLAYLRLIRNHADAVAFRRIVNVPGAWHRRRGRWSGMQRGRPSSWSCPLPAVAAMRRARRRRPGATVSSAATSVSRCGDFVALIDRLTAASERAVGRGTAARDRARRGALPRVRSQRNDEDHAEVRWENVEELAQRLRRSIEDLEGDGPLSPRSSRRWRWSPTSTTRAPTRPTP